MWKGLDILWHNCTYIIQTMFSRKYTNHRGSTEGRGMQDSCWMRSPGSTLPCWNMAGMIHDSYDWCVCVFQYFLKGHYHNLFASPFVKILSLWASFAHMSHMTMCVSSSAFSFTMVIDMYCDNYCCWKATAEDVQECKNVLKLAPCLWNINIPAPLDNTQLGSWQYIWSDCYTVALYNEHSRYTCVGIGFFSGCKNCFLYHVPSGPLPTSHPKSNNHSKITTAVKS